MEKNLINVKLDIEKMSIDDMLMYGKLLEDGVNGFEQNYELSFLLYSEAMKYDSEIAYNNVGWMYDNGFGVQKNTDKALEYYNIASDKGCTTAMINLGNYYERIKKYEIAMKWYEKAALLGDKTGLFNYANILHEGYINKPDYSSIKVYFDKLYEENYPNACFYQGLYYENGFGCERDYQKAFDFYLEGIEKFSDAYCATNLAVMIMNNDAHNEEDEEFVFNLYKFAAEHGDSLAWANIGHCYEVGQGTNRSWKMAMEAYKQGAELGEEHSIEELNRMKGEEIFWTPDKEDELYD